LSLLLSFFFAPYFIFSLFLFLSIRSFINSLFLFYFNVYLASEQPLSHCHLRS
jgi:hypothetical protein